MDNILNFSMYKGEPDWVYQERLLAYQQLKDKKDDVILHSFDEKDERGYGVVANLSHHIATVIQYGSDTIFEQIAVSNTQNGIVVLDLFEAFYRYEDFIKLAFETDVLKTQKDYILRTYFNGGVFVYVSDNQQVDANIIFLQDNSIDELNMKYVIVIKGKNAIANINVTCQCFNSPKKPLHYHMIYCDV